MIIRENNYAFIDGQNLNMSIKKCGWNLDLKKLRIYLWEKYNISQAFLFIGFIARNQNLYDFLKESGYILVFKPVTFGVEKKPKGNIDADLVLKAMIEFNYYDRAVLISSDGDFYSLVKYLSECQKLAVVISPDIGNCSHLLRKAAGNKMVFMNRLIEKLKY